MTEYPTLSIVVLNWNTADLLAICLRSLHTRLTLDYEVIVVDNNSTDHSAAIVRERFPQYRLMVLEENLGFAAGNNVALAEARGRHLLLLNSDTEVLSNALEPLVGFMEAHPRAGIAGPTLWNPDGSLQPSTAPFPTLWNEFLRYTMLYRWFPTRKQVAARENTLRQVDAVTGAALLIRRACYDEIGPLDERFFMFYEDTDWCKRAAQAGWDVYFVPTAGIVHVKGAASSRFARTRTLLDSHRSTVRYFEKHHSRRSLVVLRMITFAGALVRSLRAILQWLLGRDRADQRLRLAAYLVMARWAAFGCESGAGEHL
jgi:GT2 family glycosyltransferase